MADEVADEVATAFDAGAATWNRTAGLMGAATDAVVARLGPLAADDVVLDVACGRGEPGLSIVEATPGVRLVGVDVAPGMIEGARADAAARAVADARFEVGSADALPLDDASVDAVVSRMGMLGFPGSSPATAQEAFRVLSPGGRLAIAVWGRFCDQTVLAASVGACQDVGGADVVDMSWMDTLADGRRERWLTEAGFHRVVSDPIGWTMLLADEEALWATVDAAPPLAAALSTVGAAGRAAVRDRLLARAAPYLRSDGSYAFPVRARVLSSVRPAH